MFNFICKFIVPGRNGFNIIPRNPSMFLSFSLRLLSIEANQNSFTVSYLQNKCGLSPESALSASNHVQFGTPDKPDLVVSYFQNLGFLETHLSEMIRKYPNMLFLNPDESFTPKVQFFQSKGASTLDLARIFCLYPRILLKSLENELIPGFNFFKDLFQCDQKTISVVKKFPRIMARGLESNAVHNINILRENGVPEANILLVSRYHTCKLGMDVEKLKNIVGEVKKMGFVPSKSQFVFAIIALSGISKLKREEKVDAYKKWGWSDEDFAIAFGKFPGCLAISTDRIIAAMDLYVNKLRFEASFIAKHPNLLSLSLKHRIIPRASVIQYLSSKGLIKINPGIFRLFHVSEKCFIDKYLNRFEEASHLLKLYKEAQQQPST